MDGNQTQVITGVWWRSDSPNVSSMGTLALGSEQVVLHVEAVLNPQLDTQPLLVFGLVDGEPITLVDCIWTGAVAPHKTGMKLTFISLFMVRGAHIVQPGKTFPHEISFYINNFTDWLGVLPNDNCQTVYIENLGDCEIFGFIPKKDNDRINESNIIIRSKKSNVCLECADHDSLSFMNLIKTLTSFISLGASTECSWWDIQGKLINNGEELEIKIFKAQNLNSSIHLPYHDMLFRWPDIKMLGLSMFKSWYNLYKYNRLHMPIILYWAALGSKFREQQIIELIHCLEGIHRKLNPPNEDTEKYYRWRLQKALETCDNDVQNYIINMLRFGYEPKLEERLESLFKLIPEVISWFLKNSESCTRLLKKVVRLRNDYNHCKLFDTSEFMDEEGHMISVFLKVVCQSIFLHLLGLTQDQIIQLFNKNPKTSLLKHMFEF